MRKRGLLICFAIIVMLVTGCGDKPVMFPGRVGAPFLRFWISLVMWQLGIEVHYPSKVRGSAKLYTFAELF